VFLPKSSKETVVEAHPENHLIADEGLLDDVLETKASSMLFELMRMVNESLVSATGSKFPYENMP